MDRPIPLLNKFHHKIHGTNLFHLFSIFFRRSYLSSTSPAIWVSRPDFDIFQKWSQSYESAAIWHVLNLLILVAAVPAHRVQSPPLFIRAKILMAQKLF